MATMITMIVLAVLAAIFFMYVRVTRGGVLGVLTKTLASIFFIALGVAGAISLYPDIDKAALFIILGLVMGLVGDVVLDLKVVYPESSDLYLNAGMISFGVGHFIYIAAIIMLIEFDLSVLLASVAITIPISIAILMSSKVMKIDFGKFIVHAISYTVILTFTSVYATALAISDSRFILMSIGMILFLLSDLVLSPMYFAGKQDDKFMCVANHTLYYGAQICIATFIFMI
ncbi:MAG: lysoplasmalogenase family protein [Bacillota bacterium]